MTRTSETRARLDHDGRWLRLARRHFAGQLRRWAEQQVDPADYRDRVYAIGRAMVIDYRRDTHCPRGHDLREPGVLYETPSTGKRHCGECRRDKDRERKRAAVRRKKT